MVSRWHYR